MPVAVQNKQVFFPPFIFLPLKSTQPFLLFFFTVCHSPLAVAMATLWMSHRFVFSGNIPAMARSDKPYQSCFTFDPSEKRGGGGIQTK
jgi:hypothetical protein